MVLVVQMAILYCKSIKINLKGISADGYTLYKAAKTVYTNNPKITAAELFDKELVNDLILYIIFNGFLIAENGIKVLELEVEK